MVEFSGKKSSENLYSSLILPHAARFMARLIGVWPAVDILHCIKHHNFMGVDIKVAERWIPPFFDFGHYVAKLDSGSSQLAKI